MSHYRTIQALGTPVVVHSNLTKFLGSMTASVFLSHIMYWSDKTDNPLGVYKSCDQITDETGLSKKEQMTARKILRELGLIVETHKRLEHRMYYLFDGDAFDAWFETHLAKFQNSTPPSDQRDRPQVPKGNFGECQNSTSLYTKITTKNTTKITAESEYAPAQNAKNSQAQQTVDQPTKKSSKKLIAKPNELSDDIWRDFLQVKKQRTKTDLTQTAWSRFINQVGQIQAQCQHDLDTIFANWIAETKWDGIRCDWYLNRFVNNQTSQLATQCPKDYKSKLRDPAAQAKWVGFYDTTGEQTCN